MINIIIRGITRIYVRRMSGSINVNVLYTMSAVQVTYRTMHGTWYIRLLSLAVRQRLPSQLINVSYYGIRHGAIAWYQ